MTRNKTRLSRHRKSVDPKTGKEIIEEVPYRHVLERYFDVILQRPHMEYCDRAMPASVREKAEHRFKYVFDKMYAFELTQYEKVLVLDVDMLVLANLDWLFTLPAPAALHRVSNL